ncbi:ABC transporter substrate-binding protein [Profundibacter sp.]
MKKTTFISALALSAALSAGGAFAAELNVVCSNEQDWCDLMAGNFEDKTGISVAMVRKSTGETLAQVRAEAGNPKIDVWWGGTGDPHLIAAAEGLTQPSGADTSELLGWAQNLAEISDGRTIGIHLGVLGVAYNADILKEKGIKPPACWKDLTDPQYKGEIQVANPNSSGTAYTELATIVQIFGEDDAFRLLKEIGENVNSYTKSGSAPSKAAARGETGISIGFQHDMVKLARAGFPLEIVSPCEGTGYEVGGVSIITGAKNLDEAKQWVEFVLSAEAQSAGPEVGVFNIPSNSNATIPPEAPAVESIKLIDYDFATYGATDTRERLLSRWDKEVKPGN